MNTYTNTEHKLYLINQLIYEETDNTIKKELMMLKITYQLEKIANQMQTHNNEKR